MTMQKQTVDDIHDMHDTIDMDETVQCNTGDSPHDHVLEESIEVIQHKELRVIDPDNMPQHNHKGSDMVDGGYQSYTCSCGEDFSNKKKAKEHVIGRCWRYIADHTLLKQLQGVTIYGFTMYHARGGGYIWTHDDLNIEVGVTPNYSTHDKPAIEVQVLLPQTGDVVYCKTFKRDSHNKHTVKDYLQKVIDVIEDKLVTAQLDDIGDSDGSNDWWNSNQTVTIDVSEQDKFNIRNVFGYGLED